MANAGRQATNTPNGLTGHLRTPWAMGVLIALAIIGAYSDSLSGPFIFDDIAGIPENITIRHLWPLGPVLSPPSEGGRTVAGRPFVNLSLAINYAISGTRVWSYHAINLAVHVLAALTLWGIIRRTLSLPVVPANLQKSADWLATAAALLWAVHPLQTQSVTYTIQRAESMMGLFYLLTLYCVIRGHGSQRSALWYGGAIVVAVLGMACKEVMATVPLVVLLYDRTFLAGSFGQALRRRWALYAGLAATWLLPVALYGGRAASAGFGGPVSVRSYALTQFDFIVRYLHLSFWPSPLVLDYGASPVRSVREVLPQIALVGGLVVVTVILLRVRPLLGFLGAWFFIILAPSSSVVPISTQIGAEHRMYLPLAAIVMAAVLAARWFWQRGVEQAFLRPAARKAIGQLLVITAVAVLAGVTFHRNRDYQSGISIWTDTALKRPDNPRAHYNLGRHYIEAKVFSLAREEFLRTVQLQPDYPDGYMNLGCANARLELHEEAIADYDRAIQVSPKNADNYYNRANSWFELGRFAQAIDDCNCAIALDARHAQAYYRRGLAQAKLGRMEESLASYSEAIRVKPDYDSAFGERAISNYYLKRYDAAWADVRTFRKLGGAPNPRFIELLSRVSGRTE
ncbi:MAG TPA: tetratricopeptide repeat protein [Phycisphaerae bacterium]|nr:tetratricopeptide repeat protein [Phycisphaerae bacterium]